MEDREDDSAKLWFMNQLSDDAYASVTVVISNALLNVEEVDVRQVEGAQDPVTVDQGPSGFKCLFHSARTPAHSVLCISIPIRPLN